MYLGACKLLSLEPHEVCMVAAHLYDLRAAASFGVSLAHSLSENSDSQPCCNS